MSKFTMPVGIEFFENLRRSGCYYVDKSELIYKVACSENTSVTLFTRPRRFGKTLTMSMFQSFFDISRDSRDVFEGLEVVKHEEFCSKWMNQYPVLFLSLKDVAGLDFESAYGMLESKIADLCKAHFYLADIKKVNGSDKRVFYRLCDEAAKPNQVKSSLLTLTRMMHAHYDKPVIFLLDEYDVPLAKAHDADKAKKDYYPKMLDVARGLMSSYVDAAGKVSGQKPENYWKDTSSNKIVSEFVGNPTFEPYMAGGVDACFGQIFFFFIWHLQFMYCPINHISFYCAKIRP